MNRGITIGKRHRWIIALLLVAVCVYYAITLYSGAGVLVLPLCILFAGVYLLLPGRLILRVIPKAACPKEMRGPVTLALGAGFLVVCYLLAVRVWMPFLYLMPLPVAVVSAWQECRWFFNKDNKQSVLLLLKENQNQVFTVAALFSLLLVVFAFAGPVVNALPSAVEANAIHQDILWNVGNAAALKKSFPPWDLRFMGIPLRYHFFTDLLVAIFSIVTGASCYEVAVFGLQPLLLAAMLYTVYKLGLFLYNNKHSAMFLLVLLVTAGSASLFFKTQTGHDLFGNNFAEHLITNINGQTTAVLLSALFFALFTNVLRQEFSGGIWQILLTVYVFGLLSIAKGPVALVVLCGVLAGLLLYLFKGKQRWRALLFGVVITGVFAGVYMQLFSGGANSSMWLDFTDTVKRGVFGGVVSSLEKLPVWAGAVALAIVILLQAVLILPLPMFLSIRKFFRQVKNTIKPEDFACYGGAGAGMAAFFAFGHQSYSQNYFFFAALFFLCLLAAGEWPTLWRPKQKKHSGSKLLQGTALLLFAVGALTSVFSYGELTWRGVDRMRNGIQGVESLAMYTAADEAAAVWLRDNTPKDAVFATNRISAGTYYKNIANFYTAMSERQAHMEGFEYVQSNMGIPWQMLEDHVVANAALFSPETPLEGICRIAEERNISYLLYSEIAEGSDAQLSDFEIVFEGDGVCVYKIK